MTRKLKVMHVLCMNSYSGAENVVITLIDSLKDEIDSIYVSPDGSIRKVVEEHGIRHYSIAKVTVSNIRRTIKDIKPDIIQAHDFTAGIVCAIAAEGIPVINHLHNNSPWIKKFSAKSIAYGISCFRYNQILTVSDSVMKEFIFGSFFSKKTIVVGNPINLETIRAKAQKANICEKSDIVFLGRLTPQKNPIMFVDIVAELTKKIPNIRVAVVGEGDLRSKVENKIREYGISDNVKLYGFLDNPYGMLKEATVMCMPSEWEGFGLAAVEGLALGKPVVASRVGGLKKIVNNQCGKLCNEKQEYIDELEKLLLDKGYYETKSLAAKKRASEYDNISKYSQIMKKIYISITEK